MLAWRQHRELVELRSAAMNKDERASLQQRIWNLEKLNRGLQEKLAASRGRAGEPDGATTASDGERPAGVRRDRPNPGDTRDRGLQQMVAMRELMSKPEVQAMISLQQKAGIEQRYAPLFKNLNLPPEQTEKLKALLAERSTTMQDVMSVALEQGINPRENPEAYRKLLANAQTEIAGSIRATIGENAFAQLNAFEQTLPQRGIVYELQNRLSYTATPLSTAQAEQLVNILAANAPQRPAPAPGGQPQNQAAPPTPPGGRDGRRGPDGPGGFGGPDLGAMIMSTIGGIPGLGPPMGGPDGGGRGGPPPVLVTPAAVNQSQSVLTPPQVAALQQIQQQQQTQQQLRQLIGETMSAGQPPPPRSSDAPPRKRGPGGE